MEANKPNRAITDWLRYFAKTVLDAQGQTQQLIDFLIEKTRMHDRFRDQLNSRQDKVTARLFAAGPEGFKGRLSAENYLTSTKTSCATATRDLQGFVEIGALQRTEENASTPDTR